MMMQHNERDKKCSVCGENYAQAERDSDYPQIPQDIQLCALCIEENEDIISCQICDEYFIKSNSFEIEEQLICPECNDANTVICSVCGQPAINERRSPKRIIADLCENCETDRLYRKHIDELKLETAISHKVSFGQAKAMKTIKLMSRLHPKYKYSQRTVDGSPFDVLLINMWQFYRRSICSCGFYLVVVHGLPSRFYSFAKGSCTMTEFTKSKMFLWNKINDERKKERIEWLDGNVFSLWDHPYNLRAMTDFDMDYRKEYVYGELEYEGNNYGDTSDFYIIGSIAK